MEPDHTEGVYTVSFETDELIDKCVAALDKELKVAPLQYTVERGEQTETTTYEALQTGDAFRHSETETDLPNYIRPVRREYDLSARLAEETKLTRRTIGSHSPGMNIAAFRQYRSNPEDFHSQGGRLINEQKATVIVEHLAYDPTGRRYTLDIFTQEKPKDDFSKAVKAQPSHLRLCLHRSKIERTFRQGTRQAEVRCMRSSQELPHSHTSRKLQSRLGNCLQGGRSEARLFHRRDERLTVIHGTAQNRGMQDRLRREIFRKNYLRPSKIRRSG